MLTSAAITATSPSSPRRCAARGGPRRSVYWMQAADKAHRRTAADGVAVEGTHTLRREDDGMRSAGRRHRAVRLLQRLHLSGQAGRPGAHQQHLQRK